MLNDILTQHVIESEEMFDLLDHINRWKPLHPSVREEMEQRKQLTEWCAW